MGQGGDHFADLSGVDVLDKDGKHRPDDLLGVDLRIPPERGDDMREKFVLVRSRVGVPAMCESS
jgi:hypothetical protein